jgi:hypothetical protein
VCVLLCVCVCVCVCVVYMYVYVQEEADAGASRQTTCEVDCTCSQFVYREGLQGNSTKRTSSNQRSCMPALAMLASCAISWISGTTLHTSIGVDRVSLPIQTSHSVRGFVAAPLCKDVRACRSTIYSGDEPDPRLLKLWCTICITIRVMLSTVKVIVKVSG